MMNKILISMVLLVMCVSAYAADVLVFSDGFEGSTSGKAAGVTFVAGKDGQGMLLDSPTDSVEFPADCFAPVAGRVDFDVQLTKSISTQHKTYALLSDTGAGVASNGSLDLLWWENTNRLQFGIFDLPTGQWKWCTSTGFDFEPGKWYHISLAYGPSGMSLAVDGKVLETNPFTGALMATPKKFGYYDGYVEAPPAIIDNFKSYQSTVDYLELSSYLLCPKGDGLFDSSTISYGLGESATVSIDAVDSAGKVVAHIVEKKQQEPGSYRLDWSGDGLADGVYDVAMTLAVSGGDHKLDRKIRVDNRYKKSSHAWSQGDFFPTGVWYFRSGDLPVQFDPNDKQKEISAYYDSTLRDLSEHGVNLIVFCWVPKEYRKLLLDTCQRYDIKALVALDEVTSVIGAGKPEDQMNILNIVSDAIKDYKDHPAVAGWYLYDEPPAHQDLIQRIANAKNALELVDPKHPSFSCLNVGYEPVLKGVDYPVLLVDIYVLWEKWDGNLDGYIGELARGQRNAGDRPLWIIPQVFGKAGTWKIPTPEECRAQVWLALAYNAKGFIYFIYQSTPDGEFLQGLVDMKLKPMDGRYAEIAKLNADIKKLSPILLDLKPADFAVPAVSESIVGKGFVDGHGQRYVILASKDTKRRSVATWNGEPATDVLTGGSAGRLIVLEPGAGKLLKLAR